jgi:predicted DNA-binding transcriptional regulator AlpA
MNANDQAVTVDQFCYDRKISKSFFYKLMHAGKGPKLLRIGRCTRITAEAAAAFDLAHEATR